MIGSRGFGWGTQNKASTCVFTVAAEGGGGGGGGGGLGGPNNDIEGGSAPPNQFKQQYNCYSSPARSLAYIPLSIYIMTSRKV